MTAVMMGIYDGHHATQADMMAICANFFGEIFLRKSIALKLGFCSDDHHDGLCIMAAIMTDVETRFVAIIFNLHTYYFVASCTLPF